ncbi:MAG TPA: hypothetical protein VN903_14330 [Polyangia bacterium]|nr:hypothetical protein [Polyangia bacterium]
MSNIFSILCGMAGFGLACLVLGIYLGRDYAKRQRRAELERGIGYPWESTVKWTMHGVAHAETLRSLIARVPHNHGLHPLRHPTFIGSIDDFAPRVVEGE